MEFKGTTEKWQIDNNTIFADDYFQTHIAVISAESYDTIINKANALLISKAPEMLEMLKKLTDKDLFDYEKGEPSESYFQYMNEAEQLIKEATEL